MPRLEVARSHGPGFEGGRAGSGSMLVSTINRVRFIGSGNYSERVE